MTTYTTHGPVRGTCGHKHKTPEAAALCAAKDSRDCRRAGGYSDRVVVRTDGESLTFEEDARAWDATEK